MILKVAADKINTPKRWGVGRCALTQPLRHVERVGHRPPDHFGVYPVRQRALDRATAQVLEHESLATLWAYTSPNCVLIRAQKSVKRTRPGYCRGGPASGGAGRVHEQSSIEALTVRSGAAHLFFTR